MIYFSQDTSSIAGVIPAMDKITSTLNLCNKTPYHPAIQAAMKVAAVKLNKYYGCTDSSAAYQITMGKFHVHAASAIILTVAASPSPQPQVRILLSAQMENRVD